IEIRISLLQLFSQNPDLRVLAPEAEHGCSCHIRMMNVIRDQPTKIVRILSRSAAAAFMQKKSYAIHILENLRTLLASGISLPGMIPDLFSFAILIQPRQLRHLPPVNLGRPESQLFFKRLF